MSYDCWCDYDQPEFITVTKPRARKPHKCYECGGAILPDERYEYVFGKWDGDTMTCKTCERCHDIRQWVANNVPCFCWGYGNMVQDARDAIEAATDRAGPEVAGLKFGFLRRLVARKRFNEQRKKELAS